MEHVVDSRWPEDTRELLARWAHGHSSRVRRLESLVRDEPGVAMDPALDRSIESLDRLWPWLVAIGPRLAEEGHVDASPELVVSPSDSVEWNTTGTNSLLWLIELVATYAAQVIRTYAPGAVWSVDNSGHVVVTGARRPAPVLDWAAETVDRAALPSPLEEGLPPEWSNTLASRVRILLRPPTLGERLRMVPLGMRAGHVISRNHNRLFVWPQLRVLAVLVALSFAVLVVLVAVGVA